MKNDRKSLKLYFIIVIVASAFVEAVWIYYGEAASQAGISAALMYVPFASALVVRFKYFRKQNILGFRGFPPVYTLLAVGVPFVYLALSYGLYWLIAKGSYGGSLAELSSYGASFGSQSVPVNTAVVVSLVAMIPGTILTAFGEEVGWRGLMYPIMQRLFGWKKAIVFSGVVWAAWHLPLIIGGVYLPTANLLISIPLFIVEVFAITVIISWLRMASNSVWPAVFFHAAHNYFDQVVFQTLTANENSYYFVGETGFITVIITAIIAVIILVKRKKDFLKDVL
jgi:membrane protease YdiL (CAAX protease family)